MKKVSIFWCKRCLVGNVAGVKGVRCFVVSGAEIAWCGGCLV